MDVPTRSSRRANVRAWGAVLVGLLSVALLPAAIAYTHYTNVALIQAGWAVAPALLLGILALVLARGARKRRERTIGRVGGRGAVRLGRFLGVLGVCVALSGAVALAVYEILNQLSA
jgi:hypothetical protein